ncbi:MAG: DUF4160 domain-containing protein [Gemmatimonadaceae bacterium]
MPTVLRIGPYRYFFYANENSEPPHIHVQRDRALGKLWLQPVALASSNGFSSTELSKILRDVQQHAQQLTEAWHEFFGSSN